jgi:hypothetical protein
MEGIYESCNIEESSTEAGESYSSEAERKRTSINKAVISLLENRATVRSKNRLAVHDDLDSLAGSWSKKEAADFDKALAAQRTIGSELWK